MNITKDNIHLYYEFMSDTDTWFVYNKILNGIFEDRTQKIIQELHLLSSYDRNFLIRSFNREGDYLSLNSFGVQDTLKPIREYIEEIKESSEYKEYIKNKKEVTGNLEIYYQCNYLYEQTLYLEIIGNGWSKELRLTLDKDTKAHRLIRGKKWEKTQGEMNINDIDDIFKQIYLKIKRDNVFYHFCAAKSQTTNQACIGFYYSLVKEELREILHSQADYIKSFAATK